MHKQVALLVGFILSAAAIPQVSEEFISSEDIQYNDEYSEMYNDTLKFTKDIMCIECVEHNPFDSCERYCDDE